MNKIRRQEIMNQQKELTAQQEFARKQLAEEERKQRGEAKIAEEMKKVKTADIREFSEKVRAGIAVFRNDFDPALELAATCGYIPKLTCCHNGELSIFGVSEIEDVNIVFDLEKILADLAITHSLALAVPINELETKPVLDNGVMRQTFYSRKGLPFRIKSEKNKTPYFIRPFFWLIEVSVSDDIHFQAEKIAQFPTKQGLRYVPMTYGNGKPIQITASNVEELAKKTGVNPELSRYFLRKCVTQFQYYQEEERNTTNFLSATFQERGIKIAIAV